jgi:hypothetical protein
MILLKPIYLPGEDVKGKVIVSCDKETTCKSLKINLEGILTAKAKGFETSGKGRTSEKTYEKSFYIHRDELMIAQDTTFDKGNQEFEFQLKLPDDAKVSYEGHNASIRYNVSSTMEVSWKSTPKATVPFKIVQLLDPDFLDEVTKEVADHEGEDILELEIDSQKYCIGDMIKFRYKVNTDMKFNNLRARIEHIENSTLSGKMPISHVSVLCEESKPSELVTRNEWCNWVLNIAKDFPLWFKYENIQSGILLKLTIGRSFRFDKSAEITLLSGFCPKKQTGALGTDIWEEPKEKPRPKRLRCNTCSYSFKVKDDDVDFGTCPSCGKHIPF